MGRCRVLCWTGLDKTRPPSRRWRARRQPEADVRLHRIPRIRPALASAPCGFTRHGLFCRVGSFGKRALAARHQRDRGHGGMTSVRLPIHDGTPFANADRTRVSLFKDLHIGRLLDMSSELKSHRGRKPVGKVRLAARAESRIKRRAQHGGRHIFIDCRLDRPPAFSAIRHTSTECCERRILGQGGRCQIQQPRGDDAAAPPDFRDVT